MNAVRFSIVVPTCERAATLRFALRTCLDQAFDDYEVVVSDNHSTPETKAVVDACGSPKVRYVRTPERVAMSTNWEFGVGHARGEYVLVIGDDDGLLPHALAELDGLAHAHGPKAIRWAMALYTWPTIALPGQGDYICVPLGREVVERDGRELIREAAAFRANYTDLPMMYNTAVRRDVLDDLRRRTGRVFAHPSPDVYSGFAIAHAAGRFLSTSVAMTVSGLSGTSNGIANLFNRGRSEIEREFTRLNAKDGLHSDPTVPDLPVFPEGPTADAFAVAKRLLFPGWDIELDRRELARVCLRGARVAAADWPAAVETVRRSFDDAAELQRWFEAELAATPHCPPPPFQLRPAVLGLHGSQLHLDAAAFGVRDVAAAARLCGRVLACDPAVPYPASDHAAAAAAVFKAVAGWDEQERAVFALHQAVAKAQSALADAAAALADAGAALVGESALREQAAVLADHQRVLEAVCIEREAIIHRTDGQLRELNARLAEAERQLLAAHQQLQAERQRQRWSLKRLVLGTRRRLAGLITSR